MNRNYNIIIIGAGPAGTACAVQLRRYGLDPLLLEQDRIGGMLRNASIIENYPGFPDGIRGDDFVGSLHKHIEKYKISLIYNKVLSADMSGDEFLINTKDESYLCSFLVIATGTVPRTYTDIPVPAALNIRIAYDAIPFRDMVNKKIGIIGAGDAAFDYALQLSGSDNHIDIFNRSGKINCILPLKNRVMEDSGITYYANHKLKNLSEEPDNEGIRLIFERPGKTSVYYEDYLIFATGRKPSLGFLSDTLKGKLEALKKEKRLFMAGDVDNDLFRQVSIAGGEGIKTAMAIFKEIEK